MKKAAHNGNRQQATGNRQQATGLLTRLKRKAKNFSFISIPIYALLKINWFRNMWSFVKFNAYKFFVRFNSDGLNTAELRDKKIIVSLTSFPARINVVPYAVASLLNQSMKPDKIILWLGVGKFPDNKLPKIFDKLKACGVDMEFREDLGPHTKYFYAMKEFPEDIIITFDDDFIYDYDVIEKLYASYKKHPECVSAMNIAVLNFTPDGNITSMSDFIAADASQEDHASHRFLGMGLRGVLYPPHSLHEEAFNTDSMKKLCPKADDVWLKFMEVLNGVKVVKAKGDKLSGWSMFGSQTVTLSSYNNTGGQDIQTKALVEKYNTWPQNGRTILEMMRED